MSGGETTLIRWNGDNSVGDIIQKGALKARVCFKNSGLSAGSDVGDVAVSVDASKSDAHYGKSGTIQPESIRALLLIRF